MGDYIHRDAAKAELVWVGASVNAIEAMNSVPSADVRPVVHGHWIYRGRDKGWECSVCHSLCLLDYESEFYTSEFCPHCGADMREVKENDGT